MLFARVASEYQWEARERRAPMSKQQSHFCFVFLNTHTQLKYRADDGVFMALSKWRVGGYTLKWTLLPGWGRQAAALLALQAEKNGDQWARHTSLWFICSDNTRSVSNLRSGRIRKSTKTCLCTLTSTLALCRSVTYLEFLCLLQTLLFITDDYSDYVQLSLYEILCHVHSLISNIEYQFFFFCMNIDLMHQGCIGLFFLACVYFCFILIGLSHLLQIYDFCSPTPCQQYKWAWASLWCEANRSRT